eukprot:m.184511 g.184511  ORF g.184511 m.184511 type:complete len:141 (-) comp14714_c0_seq1:312-734(-)
MMHTSVCVRHLPYHIVKSDHQCTRSELSALRLCAEEHRHLKNLEFMLAEVYRDLKSDATEAPDVRDLNDQIAKTSERLDSRFNKYWGSLFRSGSHHSFFGSQTMRYADLYASSCVNLVNYPLFYQFHATAETVPHEAEVE